MKMQDRHIKKLWNKNSKRFITEFSILQTINSNGKIEHTYFERNPETQELTQLATCHINELDCTGLKDKNGNIIYEEDIVKFKFMLKGETIDLIGVIKWHRLGYYYIENKEFFFTKAPSVSDSMLVNNYSIYSNIKIIGNIYENSELIKDNNNAK